MCGIAHPRTDREIIDFLADNDYEGDFTPEIARAVAADYLAVYPRTGVGANRTVQTFKGEDGKIIPLTKDLRQKLAEFMFPINDDPLVEPPEP